MVKKSKIILHHSLTKDGQVVNWQAIRRYHTIDRGWRDIGYHFGIEKIGDRYEVLTGRFMNERGAHCIGQNSVAIGICLVGNFDVAPPPSEQWAVAVRFVRSICTVLSIPRSDIYGHRDYASKSCPGKLFDIQKFRLAI